MTDYMPAYTHKYIEYLTNFVYGFNLRYNYLLDLSPFFFPQKSSNPLG